jgi:outer membrane receptor for ferrienterochelin and colicin
VFFYQTSYAQQHQISGRVLDDFGEPLPGALLREVASGKPIVSTNEFGSFQFTAKTGKKLRISVSQLGLRSDTFSILQVIKDTFLLIQLQSVLMKEVLVEGATISPIARPGLVTLPLHVIQKLPVIGGEVDLIKSLSFLPGVSNGSEGSSGLYVRGGSPDQNLILLDDAIVYNPNHLFGFISAFHPLSVSKVDLYKGGFPARFGGRISSVLDIKMREGNRKRLKGQAQVGLINSSVHVDGPINKRSSFMASGRLAYLDLLFLPQRLAYKAGSGSDLFGYRMYDINLKYHNDLSDKHSLSVGLYTSNDKMQTGFRSQNLDSRFGLGWNNKTFSAKLISSLKPQLSQTITATYSQFSTLIKGTNETKSDSLRNKAVYTYGSGLRNGTIKYRLDHQLSNRFTIRYGAEFAVHRFVPNQTSIQIDGQGKQSNKQFTNANDISVFTEQEFTLFRNLRVHSGVRFNQFIAEEKAYRVVEPRLNIALSLGSNWYAFGGFHAGNQNVHLLTNSGVGLQTDVWVPSNKNVKPQFVNQISIGASKTILPANIEIKVELFYKKMRNLIDYKVGSSVFAQINSTERWDAILETDGVGRAKGFEFGANKQAGRFNLLFAYTWSKTNRQFTKVNRGKPYAFSYDFTHFLQSGLVYQLNKRWSLSQVTAYRTGQPISLPEASIPVPPGGIRPNGQLGIYTGRNQYRLPDYLRFDIGANYHKINKHGKDVTWAFSIYNLTNRRNALYAQVEYRGLYNFQTKLYDYTPQLALKSFLPIFPSISYQLNF